MELKQLEFFLACVDAGSQSKAAEKLYTTRPNVSKVIRTLENELGQDLFERDAKGVKLTPYGRSIYNHAMRIVKSADQILESKIPVSAENLYVSSYQSNCVAQLLVNYYNLHPETRVEYRQGTVEEILHHVERGLSEIGILHISEAQDTAFRNNLSGKKLTCERIGSLEACIYVGPLSPIHDRSSVTIEELKTLKFVRGLNDYFSIEDGLNLGIAGEYSTDFLNYAMVTDSDHLTTNALLKTDLASFAVRIYPEDRQYDIRSVSIDNENSVQEMLVVYRTDHSLSAAAKELICKLKEYLQKSLLD